MRERLGPTSETIPAIENGLLRKEHVEYSMAWQKLIGPRQKVIYNDIGGDASTPLFFSNPTEIISTGRNPFNEFSRDYITKYWDFIDELPIPHAGAFGYKFGEFNAQNYKPPLEDQRTFRKDLSDRKNRGYWNRNRTSNLLGEDRVLLIELKKLGVKKDDIRIVMHKDNSTDIIFDWAFPGEETKKRKIVYVPKSLDKALGNTALLENCDCYYQKGSTPNESYAILSRLGLHLKTDTDAIVAIGHLFKINRDNLTNEAYKEGLRGGTRWKIFSTFSRFKFRQPN